MKVSSKMAEATVSEPARTYTKDDAKAATTNVAQAVAILRAVKVAADAVACGSVEYKRGHVTRWGPAIGAATHRVELVRDCLIDRARAPTIDWFTSLALLEAFDAALWHGVDATMSPVNTLEGSHWMDTANVKDMCDTIISELGTLKMELAESL